MDCSNKNMVIDKLNNILSIANKEKAAILDLNPNSSFVGTLDAMISQVQKEIVQVREMACTNSNQPVSSRGNNHK